MGDSFPPVPGADPGSFPQGKKSIAQILEDNGITEKIAIKESEEFLIPFVEKAAKDGFLKDRIEARLSKFYTTL